MDILAKIFIECLQSNDPLADWKKDILTSSIREEIEASVTTTTAGIYGKVLKTKFESKLKESKE